MARWGTVHTTKVTRPLRNQQNTCAQAMAYNKRPHISKYNNHVLLHIFEHKSSHELIENKK